MAYMSKKGKGPYPNKAGDYCGNHLPGSMVYVQNGQTHEEAEYNQREWLATMRFGRPHSCKAGTMKEMQAQGYVGLYLKSDQPLTPGETEVPTPPELLEPETEKE